MAPGEFGYARRRAREAEADPGGLQYMPIVDRLLSMGPFGLPSSATGGVMQLGRDLFSGASGSRVRRGFGSPENLEAVLGDAIRMASATLLPLSTNFALERSRMAPALRQASFGYGSAPMQIIRDLLAGSGQSASSGFGFGFNPGEALKGGAALMGAMPA